MGIFGKIEILLKILSGDLFFKKFFFIQSHDCPVQRCRKGDDHPEEDLAKYGYQTTPKKTLQSSL
jgi:hypothetical protein